MDGNISCSDQMYRISSGSLFQISIVKIFTPCLSNLSKNAVPYGALCTNQTNHTTYLIYYFNQCIFPQGTGVGQAYASAYYGIDAPANQSLGWHFWQVPATS